MQSVEAPTFNHLFVTIRRVNDCSAGYPKIFTSYEHDDITISHDDVIKIESYNVNRYLTFYEVLTW